MTEFLLLFRNASATNSYLTTPQDMAEDMPLWQAWIGQIAMQGKLVSTAPIDFEGSVVRRDSISKGHPYKEHDSVLIAGYLICKAESVAEAEVWAKSCPILKYPHGSVEVRPLIPFPIN